MRREIDTGELCPYAGLRPFEVHDVDFFFGREQHAQDLLLRLNKSKFIAVLGYSGSGKSSLVKCGLFPLLLNDQQKDWEIIEMRPGNSPLMNLTKSIIQSDTLYDKELVSEDWIYSTLTRSTNGLLDLVSYSDRSSTAPLLLLVDQFEELFRFRKYDEHQKSAESLHFVNLITKIKKQTQLPIHIVITMRSEFLGNCAVFPGLPEAINDGQYLIPAMSRTEMKSVITGPVRMYNQLRNDAVSLSKGIVETVLNDLTGDQDQLPILAHTMYRTWRVWMNKEGDSMIDSACYEEAGGMGLALNQHADAQFFSLDSGQQVLCERIFKAITEKDKDGAEIRRPVRLSLLTKIVTASQDEILDVINSFNSKGAFIITNPVNDRQSKSEDLLIDICHESLIRRWTRLTNWVEEETENAAYYYQLSAKSKAQQNETGELLQGRDLKEAEEWLVKKNPNASWAARYDHINALEVNFFTVKTFIEASRDQWDRDQEDILRRERRYLLLRKFLKWLIVLIALLAIGFLGYMLVTRKQINDQNESLNAAYKRLIEDSTRIANQNKRLLDQNITITRQLEKIKADSIEIELHVAKLIQDSIEIKTKNLELFARNERIDKQLARIKRDSQELAHKRSELTASLAALNQAYKRIDSINSYLAADNKALLAQQYLRQSALDTASFLAVSAYDSLKKGQPDADFYKALEEVWSERLARGRDSQYREYSATQVGIRQSAVSGDTLVIADLAGRVKLINIITKDSSGLGFNFTELGQARLPDGNDEIRQISIDSQTKKILITSKQGHLYTLVQTRISRGRSLILKEQHLSQINDTSPKILEVNTDQGVALGAVDGAIYLLDLTGQQEPLKIDEGTSESTKAWFLGGDTIAIYDSEKLKIRHLTQQGSYSQIVFEAPPTVIKKLNHTTLITGDRQGNLWLVNLLAEGIGKRLIHTRGSAITGISHVLVDDQIFVAASSLDKHVALLRLDPDDPYRKNGEAILLSHQGWVHDVQFWDKAPFVVTSSEDATVKFWPLTSGQSLLAVKKLDEKGVGR